MTDNKDIESKPFAGFEDFDACTTHMMQNQDYDEETANKVCGALQEEYEERGQKASEQLREELTNNAEAMIDKLDLGTFSFVSNPAQPSEFVLFKSEDKKWEWKSSNLLVKSPEDDWKIVYGAVMIPGITDKQGDVISQKAIRESAHEFLESGKVNNIDADHDLIINKGTLVESWILKDDKKYELPDNSKTEYPAGTWMVGVKPEDGIKERIEQGDITGFSIYGESEKYPLSKNMKREKYIKDKNNIDNNNTWFDKMDKEEFEELFDNYTESIKESIDYSETLKDIQEAVTELNEQLKSSETEETEQEEEVEQEKQDVEDIGDALEWLEDNAPSEVSQLIADALKEEDEENDENEEDKEEKAKADARPIDTDDEEEVIKSRSFKQIADRVVEKINRGE